MFFILLPTFKEDKCNIPHIFTTLSYKLGPKSTITPQSKTNTFGIDLHPMNKAPPPHTFSLSRGDRHNQTASLGQYHNPFSEQVVSPWQQDRCLNDHSDGNAGFISGFGLMQNTPPDNSSSPSSLGWSSQYDTADSYGSNNTSYS